MAAVPSASAGNAVAVPWAPSSITAIHPLVLAGTDLAHQFGVEAVSISLDQRRHQPIANGVRPLNGQAAAIYNLDRAALARAGDLGCGDADGTQSGAHGIGLAVELQQFGEVRVTSGSARAAPWPRINTAQIIAQVVMPRFMQVATSPEIFIRIFNPHTPAVSAALTSAEQPYHQPHRQYIDPPFLQ
jgi:hypothetical protein